MRKPNRPKENLMNMKKSQWIVVIVALLAIGVLFGCQSAPADSPSPVGTWIFTATPTGGPAFVGGITFTSDGTLINMEDTGVLGLGVWEKKSDGTYIFTFQETSKDGDTLIHAKVSSTITLSKDGEQYSGPFTFQIFDLEGNLLVSGDGTAVGVRQHVEPMQ
jgi:hypothetical protein